MENFDKVELKTLEVYKEIDVLGFERWYAKAIYECENKYKKVKVTYPKIDLMLDPYNLPSVNYEIPVTEISVNIFGSARPLLYDKHGIVYEEKVIEEYPQRMTIEELERRLGYKVELVSKK